MKSFSEKTWEELNVELKRFVRSKIHDSEICKDILQEVFIKLHTQQDTLKDKTLVKKWLYQVTRNMINDHFRKQKFNTGSEISDLPEETEEKTYTGEFSKCLPAILEKLPGKYREAIQFVELKNLSQFQLAEKLKISYSGAKSRVQRGRQLLRNYLDKCCRTTTDRYGNIISWAPLRNCICGAPENRTGCSE